MSALMGNEFTEMYPPSTTETIESKTFPHCRHGAIEHVSDH